MLKYYFLFSILTVVTTALVTVLISRAHQTDKYFEAVNAEAAANGQNTQAIIIE